MRQRAPWRVAILGATGAVGRSMLEFLGDSRIEVGELRLLATARSAGTRLRFRGREVEVAEVSRESFDRIDLAIFSAGAAASGRWAAVARAAGAWVVDNSSRWRMDPAVPLVVPEVNCHAVPDAPALIANPNCSTIQLVVALAPLRARFGIRRVVVTTFQSASGKGQSGIQALEDEARGLRPDPPVFPGPLFGNVLPQCDVFLGDGYTREEEKMVEETRKILEAPGLAIHPTCVRVPVAVAHSEAVYVVTERPVLAAEAREVLSAAAGVRLLDVPGDSVYPTPLAAAGTDPVWVGRVRTDRADPRGLYLWVVADNLRKGAALNAVQIAEYLWSRHGEHSSDPEIDGERTVAGA